MPQLGILEGRILAGARNRGLFGGTLASSRTRKSVGPALFGARVLDPESMIAGIQAQAVAAGLSSAQGANIGTRAVAAQYADAPFNVAAEIQAALTQARLSSNSGAAAGRGRAADAAYAQAKAAALSAGLSASSAESIAVSAGQAAAAGLSYDYGAAIRNATPRTSAPAADPTASTPLSVLATQEQLRQYYSDPGSSAAPAPVDTTPPPAPVTSPEDVLRSTYADSSTPAADAPVPPTAKSFIVPVAALAAAYFFLKG